MFIAMNTAHLCHVSDDVKPGLTHFDTVGEPPKIPQ
jgi:hypothetical protein